MINPLNLIPPWAYWTAIGTFTTAVAVQQVRVADGRAALAEQVAGRATEAAARTQAALAHATAIGKIQRQHATEQQKKEDEYAQKLHTLDVAGSADRADAKRLRSALAAFTAGDRGPGETDAVAGQRARDRLPLIGALLVEGVELEAESRELIGRRDAEVGRLLAQITLDRAACSAP